MSIDHRRDSKSSTKMTSELPSEEPVGSLEPVAYFNEAMPTGVTVSQQGRIFVNFPKWGDDVSFTVAEIRDDKTIPYPNEALNQTNENDLAAALVSVQSVVVDPADRLWILDTGSPLFKPTQFGGPKLPGSFPQRTRLAPEALHTLPCTCRRSACPVEALTQC